MQIQQMMTIFEKAKRVLAWLGPATPLTASAFDLMREVLEYARSQDMKTKLRRLYSSAWLEEPGSDRKYLQLEN